MKNILLVFALLTVVNVGCTVKNQIDRTKRIAPAAKADSKANSQNTTQSIEEALKTCGDAKEDNDLKLTCVGENENKVTVVLEKDCKTASSSETASENKRTFTVENKTENSITLKDTKTFDAAAIDEDGIIYEKSLHLEIDSKRSVITENSVYTKLQVGEDGSTTATEDETKELRSELKDCQVTK